MCGPWKCCSPPKEVARSPPDDSALRKLDVIVGSGYPGDSAVCRVGASKCQEVVRRVENALPADTGGESAPQWPERAGLGRP
jgi:hypothetical protein